MSKPHCKLAGVKLGERETREVKAVGHSVHKAGVEGESGKASSEVAGKSGRAAHKAPKSLPAKKGGN
jgi:hypothetical protein